MVVAAAAVLLLLLWEGVVAVVAAVVLLLLLEGEAVEVAAAVAVVDRRHQAHLRSSTAQPESLPLFPHSSGKSTTPRVRPTHRQLK